MVSQKANDNNKNNNTMDRDMEHMCRRKREREEGPVCHGLRTLRGGSKPPVHYNGRECGRAFWFPKANVLKVTDFIKEDVGSGSH